MFARFFKPAGSKAAGLQIRIAQHARYMATVEGSAGRVMPEKRARATPISHDRATFTIRVRERFGGVQWDNITDKV